MCNFLTKKKKKLLIFYDDGCQRTYMMRQSNTHEIRGRFQDKYKSTISKYNDI